MHFPVQTFFSSNNIFNFSPILGYLQKLTVGFALLFSLFPISTIILILIKCL